MVKAQEPWATQVKPYLAAYGNPELLSLCFVGVDSNSLWSTYEEQNLIIAELWQETIISVSANRHEAVGQVSASVSSALWEQAGPWQKSPATHCLHSHQTTVIVAEGSFCGGNAGKWSFLYVEKINYWDQIYRKMYYCSMRLDKTVRKNGDGSVFL